MRPSGSKRGLARPAVQARITAGLSAREAAKRARVSEGYLRRVEREGAAYALARRLAVVYACPMQVFLPQKRKEDRKTP